MLMPPRVITKIFWKYWKKENKIEGEKGSYNYMGSFFRAREFIDDFNKMWYGNVRHICKKFLCRTQVL